MPRQPGIESIFLAGEGRSLPKRTVHNTFERIRRRLGWVARGGHPHPRSHDLRHTFICQALLRGERATRVEHVADAISTYVGPANVSDTYGYVSASPALMSEASLRFCRFCVGDGQ